MTLRKLANLILNKFKKKAPMPICDIGADKNDFQGFKIP